MVSEVFEKLANNRVLDHLEKCGLFSDFQYSFRSSRVNADLTAELKIDYLTMTYKQKVIKQYSMSSYFGCFMDENMIKDAITLKMKGKTLKQRK